MRPSPRVAASSINHISGKIQVRKSDPHGEFPRREQDSQIGRFVYLIGRKDSRAEDDAHEINYFTTGISMCPPADHYIEVVALPEMLKLGYMLPGPIIISPGNSQELVVPLFKFRECEDIELPIRAVRAIVKPAVYAHLQQVTTMTPTTHNSKEYSSYSEGRGGSAYIQSPGAGYTPDMSTYSTKINASYGQGVPRPHAAPPKGNHIF